jgi:hypothetical protein
VPIPSVSLFLLSRFDPPSPSPLANPNTDPLCPLLLDEADVGVVVRANTPGLAGLEVGAELPGVPALVANEDDELEW